MTTSMKIAVFRDVAPCSLCASHTLMRIQKFRSFAVLSFLKKVWLRGVFMGQELSRFRNHSYPASSKSYCTIMFCRSLPKWRMSGRCTRTGDQMVRELPHWSSRPWDSTSVPYENNTDWSPHDTAASSLCAYWWPSSSNWRVVPWL